MARKHYSLEYREQIVALVKSGRSITSVAKEFGLADQTVRNWLTEAQEGPLGWRERERALLSENAQLKEERDILAKATAWFATETTKTRGGSSSS
ncbi:MAG: transposase [Gammaproteobacteria bacterium]|nr:transposase [Gammaproteobacteria bacterium]MYC25989.1 transposase [Gammaproteobacteria bacterium]